MEILKRTLTISALLVVFAINASAQHNEELLNAFKESYELEDKGEYNQAIEKLKAVYNESSYELNLRLAWLNYEAGQFTESTAFYNKAINLMPYAEQPRFGIVYPASALGNWSQVINQYNKILENNPGNTTALYRLASIYYGKEEYEKAFNFLEKVINFYPFDYDSLILYAWINLKLGKIREAKILFNKALLLSPEDESALQGLEQINN